MSCKWGYQFIMEYRQHNRAIKIMIKEAYCSYEVSKLLKEKGFNEKCRGGYHYEFDDNDNSIVMLEEWMAQPYNNDIVDEGFLCSAPTHQMAMAWLREEKNIFISICNGNHCKFDKNIPSETVYYFFTITNSYGVYKEEEQCFDEFKTYEEAIEAALKYCLKNLI